MANQKQFAWSDIKKRLVQMNNNELVDLIRDLHKHSPENRLFLAARLGAEESNTASREAYRKKITDQFFPDRGEGKLKLGEARKAIRDYKQATGDIHGTVDLMMTYIEDGAAFTAAYGDIDEAFYDSQMSVMSEVLGIVLGSDDEELHAEVLARMQEVESKTRNIGWGYGDYISEVVGELELFDDEDGDE